MLAHGNPRPHPDPLIEVGVIRKRYDENSCIHASMATSLMLAKRSRNDPAFQFETRDQTVIERELASVPGPDAWRPAPLQIDGTIRPVPRLDREGDWVAIYDLGDEWLHVHVQRLDSGPVVVTMITDISPYLAT